MSGSTIPAALSALVTTFKTALPKLQVVDGPDYDPMIDFLAIGWLSDAEPAVTFQRDIADAGRSRDQEEYEIINLLSVHRGNATVADTRVALFALFETVCAALDADQTLGKKVTRARLIDGHLNPSLTEGGATVSLHFTVNVIAWK